MLECAHKYRCPQRPEEGTGPLELELGAVVGPGMLESAVRARGRAASFYTEPLSSLPDSEF